MPRRWTKRASPRRRRMEKSFSCAATCRAMFGFPPGAFADETGWHRNCLPLCDGSSCRSADGADSVAVSVVAEEYGQSSNAAPGQICELVTPVEGVRGVVVWHKPSARPMMGEFRRDSEFHSVRFQRQAAQSHAQMLSRRHQMPSEHGGKSPYYRKNLAAVARAYGNREARRDRA